MASKKRKAPLRWRVQSNDEGGFDELVVSVPAGLALVHAEMMSRRSIFVSVGDINVWACVKKGKVVVTGIENNSGVEPWAPPKESERRR